MNRCQSCDAPLRWARTVKGKRMPLDRDPDPKGNVTLDERGVVHVHPPAEVARLLAAGRLIFMPHHATCPNAQEHRAAPHGRPEP